MNRRDLSVNDGALRGVDRSQAALRAIEPVWSAGVLCPEVHTALDEIGLNLPDAIGVNIVTRVAPLGPVNADVALSALYNPNRELVASIIPAVWHRAAPERILAAQQEAYSPVLTRALASIDDAELAELAGLARTAAVAASRHCEGRTLLCGLLSMPWPEGNHLVIWHSAKLLREHRGDGHIAALMVAGLTGIDALVVHAAFDGIPSIHLRASRQWSEHDWNESVTRLRRRGWLTDAEVPTLTREGRRQRQWIEDRTRDLAAAAYEPLRSAGVDRMIELGSKIVGAINASGLPISMVRPAST